MLSPFRGMAAAWIGLATLLPAFAAESRGLPRSTPEKQGVSSAQVLAFVEALDSVDQVHSVMIVRVIDKSL